MSADLLRRAAVKLREYADRAPEGPWVSLNDGDRLVALRENRDHFPNGFRYLVDEPIDDTSTAEYFALMHPPVALALAELLDHIGDDVSDAGERVDARGRALDEYGSPRFDWTAAVQLARAVLREETS